MFVDPDGMFATPPLDFYDQNGNQIGTDRVDDGRKAVVTDKKEAKAIKKLINQEGLQSCQLLVLWLFCQVILLFKSL